VSSAEPHDENVLAGRLIERLLVDPVFRGEFRRDPVGACVVAGLPGLAVELGGGGSGMETLELRESRSSLAGVVMAAAVEGLSVVEAQAFVEHGAKGLHGLRVPGRLGHGVRVPRGVQKVQGVEHRVVGRVGHEVKGVEHAAGRAPAAGGSGSGAQPAGGSGSQAAPGSNAAAGSQAAPASNAAAGGSAPAGSNAAAGSQAAPASNAAAGGSAAAGGPASGGAGAPAGASGGSGASGGASAGSQAAAAHAGGAPAGV
jgi:hypothetical protein